jgi:hypothetical protein
MAHSCGPCGPSRDGLARHRTKHHKENALFGARRTDQLNVNFDVNMKFDLNE